MDITVLLKTVGVGLIVAAASQILQKTGRDDQATLVGVVGIVVVLMMIIGEVTDLFTTLKTAFGL